MNDEARKDEPQADQATGVDWGVLLERLAEGVKNLVNLRIVTVVEDVALSGEVDRPKLRFPAEAGQERKVFVTNIDLVDSDITSVIPPGYEEGGGVLDYHKAQVGQAVESMERKVKILKSIIAGIHGLREGVQPTGTGEGSPGA